MSDETWFSHGQPPKPPCKRSLANNLPRASLPLYQLFRWRHLTSFPRGSLQRSFIRDRHQHVQDSFLPAGLHHLGQPSAWGAGACEDKVRKRVKQYPFLITRDYEEDAGSVDDLLMELRDSTIVPLLLNPFQVFLTTMHLGRKSAEVFFLKQPDVDLQSNISHRKLQQSSWLFALLSTFSKVSSRKLFQHSHSMIIMNSLPIQVHCRSPS